MMIELLISTGSAFIFGSIVVGLHHRARYIITRQAAYKQLEKERRKQAEQERYLELRDMFEYNEPEWHLLNEAAGQPDFHEQNKPLRRKVDDWSKYEADDGHDSGEVEVIYAETIDGKRTAYYVCKPSNPPTTGQWVRPDWVKTTDVYH